MSFEYYDTYRVPNLDLVNEALEARLPTASPPQPHPDSETEYGKFITVQGFDCYTTVRSWIEAQEYWQVEQHWFRRMNTIIREYYEEKEHIWYGSVLDVPHPLPTALLRRRLLDEDALSEQMNGEIAKVDAERVRERRVAKKAARSSARTTISTVEPVAKRTRSKVLAQKSERVRSLRSGGIPKKVRARKRQ